MRTFAKKEQKHTDFLGWVQHIHFVYIASALIGIAIKLVDICFNVKLIQVAYTWGNILITIPLVCITISVAISATQYFVNTIKKAFANIGKRHTDN